MLAIPVQDGEHIMEGGVSWERESPEEKVWLLHDALFLAVAVCVELLCWFVWLEGLVLRLHSRIIVTAVDCWYPW